MAVGAAALLFAALLLFLLMPPAGKSEERQGPAQEAAPAFAMKYAEAADWGGKPAALLHIYKSPEGNYTAKVICSRKPLQNSVVLLSHPASPGTAKNLSALIASELSKTGFSSTEGSLEQALAMRNGVIIAPTGATPDSLLGNLTEIEARNSRAIVLESLPGRSIDEAGNIREMNASGISSVAFVRMVPGKEGEAAAQAATLAVQPEGRWEMRALEGGNATLPYLLEGNGSEAYCRVVALLGAGRARFADSGRIDSYAARLTGPARVLAGKEAEFELSGIDESEVGRRLNFTAIASLGGNEALRGEIAGGAITSGWASRFSLGFPGSGGHILRVADQFGRVHAKSYVEVEGLDARLASHDGNRYEFQLSLGGKPASGKVRAWIDGGQAKEYVAANGTLEILAAPSQGSHALHFDHEGARAGLQFVSQEGGFAESYAKYAAAGAMLLAAFYLLIGASKRAKYVIVFPDSVPAPPAIAGVSAADIAGAWEDADRKNGGHCLPAFPHEIASCLKLPSQKKGEALYADSQSALFSLRKLCRQGRFTECDGGFMPSNELSGFSPAQLGILRLVHDLMLERGLRFRKGNAIDVEGGEYELALFRGKENLLEKIGKTPRVVLFESEEELRALERVLAEPSPGNNRVKIAISNHHLQFAVAGRKTIEPLLP